jgi:diguanylate cyclase (GGDEF)-like protein
MSLRDELTGVYNRRGFLVMAGALIAMARRKKREATLLYFDLDGLKRANDVYGHAAGDILIRDAAATLKATFREIDVVARLGGDELVVLCPETSRTAVSGILERVNQRVAERNRKGRNVPLAWSVGFATFDPDQPSSIEELLATADAAMFEDKTRRKAGR